MFTFTAEELLLHKVEYSRFEHGGLFIVYGPTRVLGYGSASENLWVEIYMALFDSNTELGSLFDNCQPESSRWTIAIFSLQECIDQMFLHPQSTLDDAEEELWVDEQTVSPTDGLKPFVKNYWRKNMVHTPEALGIVRELAGRTLGMIDDRYRVTQCYGINTKGTFVTYYWFSDHDVEGYWYSHTLPRISIEPVEPETFDERCMLHAGEHDQERVPTDEDNRCLLPAVIWTREWGDQGPYALCQKHWNWHYPTPERTYVIMGVSKKFVGYLHDEHLVLSMIDENK